mmetsp:Transcript_29984/g.57260  ORF Transcript_29984/g.57260 Transcript_29984/m.57260 type:complete len:416 (+) Transcript_29984:91-1338(+)
MRHSSYFNKQTYLLPMRGQRRRELGVDSFCSSQASKIKKSAKVIFLPLLCLIKSSSPLSLHAITQVNSPASLSEAQLINRIKWNSTVFDANNKPTTEHNHPAHLKAKIASSVAKTERRQKERNVASRPTCPRCYRPPILCICPSLPSRKIKTKTDVLILQHPREFRRRSLSTVPIMSLVLENCTVKRGYRFEVEDLDLVSECLGRGVKPLLLFPGKNAISLDGNDSNEDYESTSEFGEQRLDNVSGISKNNTREGAQRRKALRKEKQLLILVDGTWAEAKRMIMQSPQLTSRCQQIQFTSSYTSIYDVIRKEPEKHCISTLEACAHALTFLEPGTKSKIDDDDSTNEYNGGSEAKKCLKGAMKFMVDKKQSVFNIRDTEPRFTKPGNKIREKNKRRVEIMKQIFHEEKSTETRIV